MNYYTLQITKTVLREGQKPFPGSPEGIVEYARTYCFSPENQWREQSLLVFVSKDLKIEGHFVLGLGGFDSVTMDKRLACLAMLGAGSTRSVLVHNHPGGNPKPSQADIEQTREIKRAFNVIGCELLDHIILGEESFFSFSQEIETKYNKKKAK